MIGVDIPFIDAKGRLTTQAHTLLSSAVREINKISGRRVDEVAAAALATARTALSLAQEASDAAGSSAAAASITGFTLNPPSLLSIFYDDPTGATATVQIAAHTRDEGGGPIAVDAGSISVARPGTYSIYYDDPTSAGGAVTYAATTDPTTLNAIGRKLLGQIGVTPFVSYTGGGQVNIDYYAFLLPDIM